MGDLAFDLHEVRRGSAVVLRDVKALCAQGTLHAILGPNGAGKSTLLRALAGLEPSRGAVRFAEHALHDASPSSRARLVAWVPQSPAIPEDVSVAHVVSLARAHRGESRATVELKTRRALARCGVEDLHERSFAELSAGQRQRTVIARALATEAPVLLLDEPFSALDLRASLRLDELLRDLARAGCVVLVVLHDLAHAARLADEVHVIAEGTRLASGPPSATLTESMLARVWGVRATDTSLHAFATIEES